MKTNKISTYIMGALVAGALSLIPYTYHLHKYTIELNNKNTNITEHYTNEIRKLNTSYSMEIETLKKENKKTTQALTTALKKNELIETLANKPMSDWSVDTIMEARKEFDSIPYGSLFKHGHYVTAPFGSKELTGPFWGYNGHKGIDLRPLDEKGNKLYSYRTGLIPKKYRTLYSNIDGRVVTYGRNDKVYGHYLIIESLDGKYQLKLAHLDSIAIFDEEGNYDLSEGLTFKRGQRIAVMGNSGKTTGPHLHLEYYIREADNSYRLLNANSITDYTGE